MWRVSAILRDARPSQAVAPEAAPAPAGRAEGGGAATQKTPQRFQAPQRRCVVGGEAPHAERKRGPLIREGDERPPGLSERESRCGSTTGVGRLRTT